ncbi:putative inactive leucine-rich repeat receptor-like protein kinase [Fagus crenata]
MDNSYATHVLFLLWFFAASFSLSFCKVDSNISCNEKEKHALFRFKRGLIDPWNTLSSWSEHEDCCRWAGVQCDNKTGRVRELHLSSHSLHGEISPSLLELEHLNYLDLSFNNFNCTCIPSFLGSMGRLRRLDLGFAGFCGLIPHQLGNLSGLHYLDLSDSDLYVDNLHWILNPSLGFVNFTSLLALDLSLNFFNHEIPNWFSNLSTTLLELDLSYNELKGEIPHGISNFQNLESLSLGYNHLTGKIPESFGQLKHLTTLDLQHNSFNGSIPSSLGNLSYMSSLILCDNKLNGTLPKSLGVLSNLEQLDVKDNFLGGSVFHQTLQVKVPCHV